MSGVSGVTGVSGTTRIGFRSSSPFLALYAVVALTACSGRGHPVDVSQADTLIVQAGTAQSSVVATPLAVDPVVVLQNTLGQPRANAVVRFAIEAGAGWVTVDSVTTDAAGRATTRWYLGVRPGVNRLRAQAGTTTTTILANARELQPGTTYFGRNQYVEFRAGDFPVVITAPHGGQLLPADIPDRTVGETVRDSNTDLLAEETQSAFLANQQRPFVIISRLHRRKLDANREIVEAAQGNQHAEIAWREFHGFIEAARAAIDARQQNGLVIDLHGHGHAIPRLELGYLLNGAELERSNDQLDLLVQQASVRGLAQRRQVSLAVLVRGSSSLGALFEAEGLTAVPSQSNPHPGGAPFFSGGYITERHGSVSGTGPDAVQIESHFAGVRDTDVNRQQFARALVTVVGRYRSAFNF